MGWKGESLTLGVPMQKQDVKIILELKKVLEAKPPSLAPHDRALEEDLARFESSLKGLYHQGREEHFL